MNWLHLVVSVVTVGSLVCAPPVRAYDEPRASAERLFLDTGNFPLMPAVGSAFGWALAGGLWEGGKAVLGSAAIGAPAAIGMQLLAQNAMGLEVDTTKAVVSGLASTLVPLVLTGMTGPAAPLVYFGVSMAASYASQYLLERWRDQRAAEKRAARPHAVAGPAAAPGAPVGGLALLGVSSASMAR